MNTIEIINLVIWSLLTITYLVRLMVDKWSVDKLLMFLMGFLIVLYILRGSFDRQEKELLKSQIKSLSV